MMFAACDYENLQQVWLATHGPVKPSHQLMDMASQQAGGNPKVASPHSEDDFEIGFAVSNDVDLCPGRLLQNVQHPEHVSALSRAIACR